MIKNRSHPAGQQSGALPFEPPPRLPEEPPCLSKEPPRLSKEPPHLPKEPPHLPKKPPRLPAIRNLDSSPESLKE